jgi:hypothetical protein
MAFILPGSPLLHQPTQPDTGIECGTIDTYNPGIGPKSTLSAGKM